MLSDEGQETGPEAQIEYASAQTLAGLQIQLGNTGQESDLTIVYCEPYKSSLLLQSLHCKDETSLWAVWSPQTEQEGENAD